MKNVVTDSMVEEFEQQGVIVVRGVFAEWVETLARGVTAVMADPSPLERSYKPSDGSAPFFQDYCNWQRVGAFRSFVFESPASRTSNERCAMPTRWRCLWLDGSPGKEAARPPVASKASPTCS